jgi:hypothetical protein
MMSANSHQIKGSHYNKYALQPWDLYDVWNMNPFAAQILNYIVRYRDKDGVWDLKKARHFLDKWIEVEEAKLRHDPAIPTLTDEVKP